MPVGPLSLNDEVGLDLGLKILKATKAQLGDSAILPEQEALLTRLVEGEGRYGRKNRKGFYDYPEGAPKRLWPVLKDLQTKHLDPELLDMQELKQRLLVTQALEAARTVEEGVITDPREADVGRFSASDSLLIRRGAVLHRPYGSESLRRTLQGVAGEARRAVCAAQDCSGHGSFRRNILRPGGSQEKGGVTDAAQWSASPQPAQEITDEVTSSANGGIQCLVQPTRLRCGAAVERCRVPGRSRSVLQVDPRNAQSSAGDRPHLDEAIYRRGRGADAARRRAVRSPSQTCVSQGRPRMHGSSLT